MIYSFQGAERSNFQRFRQYFEQHGLTAKLLQLRVNYRSVGAIVEASNLVANQRGDNAVGATSTHLQKQMVSGLEDHNEEHVTGAAIRVVECSSDPNAIFTYVGAQITRILQEAQRSGINNTGNIAVLYRQNATGKELKKYLKDHFPHIQTKQHKSDTAGIVFILIRCIENSYKLLIYSPCTIYVFLDVTGVDTRNQLKRVTRLVIAWLRTAVDPSENSSCAVCLDDIELSSSRSAKRVTSNGEMSVLQRAQDLLSTGRARSLFEAACIVVRTNESLIQSPVGKKRKATGKGNNAFIQSAANKLHKLESLHDRIAANEETLPRMYLFIYAFSQNSYDIYQLYDIMFEMCAYCHRRYFGKVIGRLRSDEEGALRSCPKRSKS